MGVNIFPKLPTKEFLAGLAEQHVVGAAGLGVNQISATLACNTAMTIAQLVANAPNTATVNACGPIVHSLGKAPTYVNIEYLGRVAALTGIDAAVQFQFVTADNSAVYVFAKTWTGASPLGVAVRVNCIP